VFVINQRDELIQGSLFAAAPGLEQMRDFVRGWRGHNPALSEKLILSCP
jgi:hypothetical protein